MRALTSVLLLTAALCVLSCSGPQWKRDQSLGEFNIQKKIAAGDRQIAVCLEEFSTAKSIPNPQVIGDARVSGFNVHAEVRSDDPVQLLITRELRRAFLSAGFRMEDKEKSDFAISGRVERFWVDENLGSFTENAKASVRYDIILRNREGRFVWGKSVEKREVSGKSIDATKDDIPTLMNALRKSIESIFEDESLWNAMKQ